MMLVITLFGELLRELPYEFIMYFFVWKVLKPKWEHPTFDCITIE